MAREKGMEVDMDGFNACMNEQKNRSRKAADVTTDDWIIVNETESVEFTGYDSLTEEMELVKYRKVKKGNKEQYQLVFSRTPFYAESGGQVGDTGEIIYNGKSIRVNDTQKENNLIMHLTDSLPEDVNGVFTAKVDGGRRKKITMNHSATHLLHAALKQVLGKHVNQKGSLVNDAHTRFDFSHFAKVSDEELAQIEKIVNEKVRENIRLQEERNVPIQQAMDKGAMALFGEKYGDFVRVITFDPSFSVELCGGTHVRATGEIGYFRIMSESSVAAGVRRVEAITGAGVEEWINQQMTSLNQVKELLKHPKDVVKGVESLLDENAQLKAKLEQVLIDKARSVKSSLLSKVNKVNGINMIVEEVELPSADLIKNISFDLKNQLDDLFLLIGADIEGKPHLSLIISENLIGAKNMDATKIIRTLAKEIQGGGGGQPFYATAGGKKIEGLKKALEEGRTWIADSLH
jgi:alanyl-tRNA synthetase